MVRLLFLYPPQRSCRGIYWFHHVCLSVCRQILCRTITWVVFLRISFLRYLEIFDSKNAIVLCKFRTTNHRLPIEIGRWQNIERNNRKCLLCDTNTMALEMNFIIFYDVDTLSKTIRTSSQVTLEIGQMFLN